MNVTRPLLTLVFLAFATTNHAAEKAKIYVFAAPEAAPDKFLGGFVPATLGDSVRDLRKAINEEGILRIWGTDNKDAAVIWVQVVGREEVSSEYRVRVHVTTRDGRSADLTGTSVHQWKQSAKQLARQIVAWVSANEDSFPTSQK